MPEKSPMIGSGLQDRLTNWTYRRAWIDAVAARGQVTPLLTLKESFDV
jgi:hypothetical protein